MIVFAGIPKSEAAAMAAFASFVPCAEVKYELLLADV